MRNAMIAVVVVLCGCAGSPPVDGPAAGFVEFGVDRLDIGGCSSAVAFDGTRGVSVDWSPGDRLHVSWMGGAGSGIAQLRHLAGGLSTCSDVYAIEGAGVWIFDATCEGVDLHVEVTSCDLR